MLEGLVAQLLNRFLGAYIDGFDPKQLNVGIWSGDVKLRNLKLKREALDKFKLPIDVSAGYVGELTLSIPWSNLAKKPVKVFIDNVFLLAAPKIDQEYDEADDRRRARALKQEKLESAELLSRKQADLTTDESKRNQSFAESLTTKIVDNLQITINSVHIRYEDSVSAPDSPFSVGITLNEFSALSTDAEWNHAFIEGNPNVTYKLATLGSMSVYWNTDSESLIGKDFDELTGIFDRLIPRPGKIPDHQYILKPVSATGRITMNKLVVKDSTKPKTDVALIFDQIAFAIDQDQYRDALMLVDTFHFFLRHQEYRRHRPSKSVKEDPRAWLQFAGNCVLRNVHERHVVWTWDYMKQRRNERREYIDLWKKKVNSATLTTEESARLKHLEDDLKYEDIRFYRSLARGQLRKENALKPKQIAQQASGWLSWAWGGGTVKSDQATEQDPVMTEQQRKELYDAIEWDEKTAVAESVDAPKETVMLNLTATLKGGSFVMRRPKKDSSTDVLTVDFHETTAKFVQRPDSFYADMALKSMRVKDGTTPGSLYTDMIRVKESSMEADSSLDDSPLFFAAFERNPLSGKADSEVTARLKALEIVYNVQCIETVMRFLQPPKSQIESITALIQAAGETVKDFREQGRAGLEFALSEHKTIAAHLDLQAPLIVIPESCTRADAPCIIVDAGKIHIESELVEKERITELQRRQTDKMAEDEIQELQALCYDKFKLRLEATQILIGPSVQRSLEALNSEVDRQFHVVDRINMDFLIEVSILPKNASLTLTKLRISGHLPSLSARVSDRKYHTMMRIIDIAVPKSDEAEEARPVTRESRRFSKALPSQPLADLDRVSVLTDPRSESDHDSQTADPDETADTIDDDADDKFVAAPEAIDEKDLLYRQRTFEFRFTVGELRGSLFKAEGDEEDGQHLVDVVLQQFALDFSLRQYDMQANVVLKSLVVDDRMNTESPPEFQKLVTSERLDDDADAGQYKDLVRVQYTQVKPTSPEYQTVFGGIDRHVDVALSTINVIVTQKSVLTLFDFILTTFTSQDPPKQEQFIRQEEDPEAAIDVKMRVKVELTSIVLILNQDGIRLATIKMSKGDVGVFMSGPTMRVGARIGNFSVRDDINTGIAKSSPLRQLIDVQGDELADFRYETFARMAATYPGYDSSVYLRLSSIKVNFLEEPMRKILAFGAKFARMKAVFDEARNMAMNSVQQAQQQAGKMHFDLLVRTPIVVFPRISGETQERDVVTANLGELFAINSFERADSSDEVNHVSAGIRNISLASKFHYRQNTYEELQMIEDADATVEVVLPGEFTGQKPAIKVTGNVSDIKLKVTQSQYQFLMDIMRAVPAIFANEDEVDEEERELSQSLLVRPKPEEHKVEGELVSDLEPELGEVREDDQRVAVTTSLDADFTIGSLGLELFSNREDSPAGDLEKASLSRFLLSSTVAKLSSRSDGSSQGEINVRSFTVNDTRYAKNNNFREVIPAIDHEGDQFNASITLSGGANRALMAMLTIDSPRVIFSLEHVFALQHWISSAFDKNPDIVETEPAESASRSLRARDASASRLQPSAGQDEAAVNQSSNMSIAFRVNIVDPSIMLVANAADPSSEAIILSAKQILLIQQTVLTFEMDRVAMFLCRMDDIVNKRLRILDDFSMNVSLDSSKTSESVRNQCIEIAVEPLVLRVSLRDIMLAMNIASKASQLSAAIEETGSSSEHKRRRSSVATTSQKAASANVLPSHRRSAATGKVSLATKIKDDSRSSLPNAPGGGLLKSTLVSREELKATLKGLRLVLIGSSHELPMLDMCVSSFQVAVTDWSSDMHIDTNIDAFANVYNFAKSHWEPLIEPWSMGLHVAKSVRPERFDVNIFSRKRVEMTVTSSTIALFSKAVQYLSSDEDVISKPRSVDGHYRIMNMTGYTINIWSDGDDSGDASSLEDGEEIPWSFEAWQKQRENVTSDEQKSKLAIKLEGTKWESITNVPVNMEGERVYTLRTRSRDTLVNHRIIVDVRLRTDFVKYVTIRSGMLFENRTKIPLEIVAVDASGNKKSRVYNIAPDEDCAAPIEAGFENGIKIRPDPGFHYQWSHQTLYWKELYKQPTRSIQCKPTEDDEVATFNFQCHARFPKAGLLNGRYPHQIIRISPPVEINNLLPYDFKFRIFDQTTQRDFSHVLTKGVSSPVHTVELSHVLLLAVKIQDSSPVYKPSKFSVIHTNNPDEYRRDETLVIEDQDGNKTQLGVHFTEVHDSGGSFVCSIFSPYLILNKTGLDICVRCKSFLQKARSAPGNSAGVIPFHNERATPYMHSYTNDDRKNRSLIRAGDSSWSKAQSFEAIGSVNDVIIPAAGNQEIHLGIQVEEGEGKYKLTKVVSLTPRFVLKSRLNEDILLREPSSADILELSAGDRIPLHFMRQTASKQLCLCMPGVDNDWSNPFSIMDVGRVYVKVQKQGEHQRLIKIDILLEAATIFLHLTHEDKNWPFVIRNESHCEMIYYQGNPYIEDDEDVGKRIPYKPQRYKIPARSIMPYAWDFPAAKSPVLILSPTREDARVRHLRLTEIGSLEPFRVPADPRRGTNGGIIDLSVVADGPTRKLIMRDYNPDTSLYKVRKDGAPGGRAKLLRTDSSSSVRSSGDFETINNSKAAEVTFRATIRLEGLGLSLVNSRRQELAYCTLRNIEATYTDSLAEQSYDLVCKWIQIDNQLYGGIYPILLYPTMIPKTGREIDMRPAFRAAVTKAKDDSHGVFFVKYATVLLQEMTMEVDEDFLFALLDFSKVPGASWAETHEGKLCDDTIDLPEPDRETAGNDAYFEVLHLQPIQMNLSFVRTERVNVEDKTSSRNPLMFFFNILTMALGNINEAPVRLNALLMENVLTSYALLSANIQAHYGQEFFYQIHKILGSADFLGNPVGLFTNISSGVADIFYEPYQGFVMSDRPGELGIGIAKGTASFVKKTVFGISDSISKVTGSVSKGLSVATMDKQFQDRRRMTRSRNRPKHALYGLQNGGLAFISSIGSGVEGLARQPFEGAERDGAAGFFKGVGKGLIGLATKPVIGVFDLASNVTEGIRNTTTVFDSEGIDKVRLPRHVGRDGIVRPYNASEALGLSWLKQLDNGKYHREDYLAHYNVTDGAILLITYRLILLCRLKGMQVEWDVAFRDLKTIALEKTGLQFVLKGARGPFVPIDSETGRRFVYAKIRIAVEAYNAEQ
ncbi:Vacuolar protein sorting-associated protein 13 [Savitreella phatthalungensis]